MIARYVENQQDMERDQDAELRSAAVMSTPFALADQRHPFLGGGLV